MDSNLFYFLPADFEPKKKLRDSAKDIVVNHIKNQIIENKLNPGDRLPVEGELALQLQVGRGSVREAIKELQSIGVVDIQRGEGTFITKGDLFKALQPLLFSVILSRLDSSKIYELRFMFELSILNSLIERQLSLSTITHFRNEVRNMQEYMAGSSFDKQDFVKMDYKFHSDLAAYMDNDLAKGLYCVILSIAYPFAEEAYADKSKITSIEDHSIILDALERRDKQLAREATEKSLHNWIAHFS